MDAIFIGKMSIASKRQIPQIVEQFLVCSRSEPVEDCSQLYVLPAVNVYGDSIALLRCSLRESQSVAENSTTPLFK
jgi:hypothetical protein